MPQTNEPHIKEPIPVTILTGFLGAGKTTFLNAFIRFRKEAGHAPLIIENEYGQENIDSQLVIGADHGIFEFTNGCLCCDLNEELFELLAELWEKRAEFDELIIETTGIADPASVAIPFLTNPSIARGYRLERVVGLVDPGLIEWQLEQTEEARKQISFSDILLISRTEQLSPSRLKEVQILLQQLNPFARILSGNKLEGYPMEDINLFLRDNDNPHHQEAQDHHDHHDHHHHHHHHDIVSLSFRFTEPFDMPELEYRLLVFLQAQAKNIYRVKGIVYGEGQEKRIVVQSVGHFLGISEGNTWGADEERISRLVFIGKNLKAEGFEKFLRQCFYHPDRRRRDK
jgi:G3E family GTPase